MYQNLFKICKFEIEKWLSEFWTISKYALFWSSIYWKMNMDSIKWTLMLQLMDWSTVYKSGSPVDTLILHLFLNKLLKRPIFLPMQRTRAADVNIAACFFSPVVIEFISRIAVFAQRKVYSVEMSMKKLSMS